MGRAYRFFYVFLLVLLFLVGFFHPITPTNVDLGRYLLLGEIITETHQVPATNLLSYTYPDFPYINTSWLTGVLYYNFFVWGGYSLLVIFNTALVALAFGLLVFYSVRKYPLTFATLFSVTIYIVLLKFRSDVRPEVVSMLFLSLFMVTLFSYRKKGGKKILFLIPLELLWVNSHIYFFVGPILILFFLFDYLITHRFKFTKAKLYLLVLVGTIAVTLINPNGLKGALFPLTVFNNYGFSVMENQSLLALFDTYHLRYFLFPIVVIGLLFSILFLARKNTRPIDWLLAIFFSLATVFIYRNILLFVFATYLSFARQLNFLTNKYQPLMKKIPRLSYLCFYPLSLLIPVFLIISWINKDGFGSSAYPKTAVDFLITHNIKGPFFNDFEIGDALSYRIYPQLVFVDSRPEAYPASFFQSVYTPMKNNPSIFKKFDDKYHYNAIVMLHWDYAPRGSYLLRYLVNDSNFKLIYLDEYTLLLARDIPANKDLINRYFIDRNSFVIPSVADRYGLVRYLFFFDKVGWRKEEEEILAVMRKSDPELCILKQYSPIEGTFLSKYVAKYNLMKYCPI